MNDGLNAKAFSAPVSGLPSTSSRLSRGSAALYTIWPAGPHDGESTRPRDVETLRSAPVATFTAHTDAPSSRVDANAISLSSGDQLGM